MEIENIPRLLLKNLVDRSYEKRRLGQHDLEGILTEMNSKAQDNPGQTNQMIVNVIDRFNDTCVCSTKENWRIGGVIALATIAISLDKNAHLYLDQFLPLMLKSVCDQEARVRYYACEALFNTVDATRVGVLRFFNEVWDGLCRLSVDVDDHVRQGSLKLDSLLREVVTEAPTFDAGSFVPLLKERIRIKHYSARKLVLGWVEVLAARGEMLTYVKEYLGPIFEMLGDGSREISKLAFSTLTKLLGALASRNSNLALYDPGSSTPYADMLPIIVAQCNSPDKFITSVALSWVREFVYLGKDSLLHVYDTFLELVLSHMAHGHKEIRHKASSAHKELLNIVNGTDTVFDVQPILHTLTTLLLQKPSPAVPSTMGALKWFRMLFRKLPNEMDAHSERLFKALLTTLQNKEYTVVEQAIIVLAGMTRTDGQTDQKKFRLVLNHLLVVFRTHRKIFLIEKERFIIRKLCVRLGSIEVLQTLAAIVAESEDEQFASQMVEALNLIVLTAPEMAQVRTLIRDSLTSKSGRQLFEGLYTCWCHNPVATFGLCLFAQAYELAAALIFQIYNSTITKGDLAQVHQLVTLIESPMFIHLRMQVLEPTRYPHLLTALYGLLMLLPQGPAFSALNARLQAVTTLDGLSCSPGFKNRTKGANASKLQSWWDQPVFSETRLLDFPKFLKQFGSIQERQKAQLKESLVRQSLLKVPYVYKTPRTPKK